MDFAPAVYEHAARLINKTPWEVSRSGSLLYDAHSEAFRCYRHSPVVIGIDIYNIEAEAYGAIIGEPEGAGVPAVSRPVCTSTNDIPSLKQYNPSVDGRMPMVLETAKRFAAAHPDADVRVPVSGPFSIAAALVGLNTLLCEAVTDPDDVRKALVHLAAAQEEFCRAIVNAGLGVSLFESAATPPLLSPDDFRGMELPALAGLIAAASATAGKPVPCIIGGNTAPIVESLLETGTMYVICPSETDQALFMKTMERYPDVVVRVNMDPKVLTLADIWKAFEEIDRIVELSAVRQHTCIGTGVLPYEAIPATVLKARDYALTRGRGIKRL
ncbi:MAG: hypothetical protein A2487_09235 [Candidatus Raymondbacteria bacterium RifOxyC12_full_50_8]|uniref:Uroporphyrinogen decarboxylase (URO-D) domain-containing protein n=1 Tax=Candidatus Raymondbacteria bacterium RIFOXYD12_FULL_49_13 TaxID=1817890 RepID=A0A1F7FFJ5_UNCRA|nr:MAG: hypothetical protein A2248_22705 [Candidatus Raymondbacteria bacterium RIFOXYA2_FULL_49_16]OGJ94601.1 MAG: hypothetical protein A2350_05965 [Candidatus Raymondbacteria bacterium RifOxyB12_full_50_8]OGJ98871.1 MAG: hypothetical protein A2487_09235 [Candidatus Raymondbacteria bacterium RifOxyC12_full_50_8]OGK05378.1 MAG: hypothetical protein A2519_03655 [Candidatus Raymondbacteria bacterium RIFOXYD12_FULL_49_13]OGP42991.1 MAG: hypothetical protein A2324_16360 [Candidatus Raymondbacteria b